MAALFPPTLVGLPPPGAPAGPPPGAGGGGSSPGRLEPPSASQIHSLIAFTAVMTTAAFTAVSVRLYARSFIANRIGVDDYMAIGALLTTFGYNVVQCINVTKYLTTSDMGAVGDLAGKLYFATEILYNFALAFIKMTFLFQFFRIFQYVHKMRIAYIVAIVVVGAWSVSQILLPVFICRPVQANYTSNVPGAVCMSSIFPTYGNAAGTIVSDIIVLFLPLPTLWSLRLSTSQKWAVLGVFGIGAVVPIISAVRVWSIGILPPDGPWVNGYATMSELTAGVITAALATVRLLFSRHFPALPRSQTARGHGKNTFLSKLSNLGTAQTNTELSSQHAYAESEIELFHQNSFGLRSGSAALDTLQPGDRSSLHLGVKTKITTGKYDRPVSAGAAEFLGEFGIRVERNVEVQETIIRK